MINFGIDIVEVTQVAFPATAVPSGDPNTLDDYEEGEWDAIVTDGTNDATMNALFTTQRYTKVGRKVHLQGLAAITAVGALAGNVRITGTPFFAAAGGVADKSSDAAGSVSPSGSTLLNQGTGQLVLVIEEGTDYLVMYESKSGANRQTLTHAQLTDISNFIIGITYTI